MTGIDAELVTPEAQSQVTAEQNRKRRNLALPTLCIFAVGLVVGSKINKSEYVSNPIQKPGLEQSRNNTAALKAFQVEIARRVIGLYESSKLSGVNYSNGMSLTVDHKSTKPSIATLSVWSRLTGEDVEVIAELDKNGAIDPTAVKYVRTDVFGCDKPAKAKPCKKNDYMKSITYGPNGDLYTQVGVAPAIPNTRWTSLKQETEIGKSIGTALEMLKVVDRVVSQ